jgi:hypothetical protein
VERSGLEEVGEVGRQVGAEETELHWRRLAGPGWRLGLAAVVMGGVGVRRLDGAWLGCEWVPATRLPAGKNPIRACLENRGIKCMKED